MPITFAQTGNHARDFIFIRTYSFARLNKYLKKLILFAVRFSSIRLTKFAIHCIYFGFLALFGSMLLMVLHPSNKSFKPRYVDMFFMSTSALTVSGLGTIETENLSSAQIVILTLWMLFGGEVFITLLGLMFRNVRHDTKQEVADYRIESVGTEDDSIDPVNPVENVELGLNALEIESTMSGGKDVKVNTIRYLRNIVLTYHVTFHVVGTSMLWIYISFVSSAKNILKQKGINIFLFSFSATVSSFANGGLIPTNENMAIFNKNPAILLFLAAQVLAGNLLFPLFLRSVISILRRFSKAKEFDYMLRHSKEVKYGGLLSKTRTFYLSLTVIGFITAMVVLFCSLDWYLAVFDGLNSFEKIVAALFMAANSRHAGENSIDPSLMSPAVIVLFIAMMYFPPMTSFSPIKNNDDDDDTSSKKKKEKKSRKLYVQNLLLSQLSYILLFIIILCITERSKLYRDPINFSTLNMVFEIVSGYGNVGLSMGYSCSRLLKINPDAICEDRPISFSGWWSDEGKIILCFVMLYGRLKNFSASGGKAWRLY